MQNSFLNIYSLLLCTILNCFISITYAQSLPSDSIKLYIEKGQKSSKNKQFQEALFFYKKALKFSTRIIHDSINRKKLFIYYKISYCFQSLDEIERFLSYEADIHKYQITNDISYGRCLVGLGAAYMRIGNFERSSFYIEKALKTYQKSSRKNDSLFLANNFRSVGILKRKFGEYEQALLYHNKALDLLKASKNNINTNINLSYGRILGSKANAYKGLEKNQTANQLYQQAQEKFAPHLDKPNFIKYSIKTHLNHSDLLLKLNKCEQVLRTMHELKRFDWEKFPNKARIYRYIGKSHACLGNYDAALDTLQISIDLRRQKHGDKHYYTAVSFATKADAYQQKGALDEALLEYQKALYGFVYNFNDTVNVFKTPSINQGINSEIFFLETLKERGKTLELKAKEAPQQAQNYLQTALNTYLLADSVITQLRQDYKSEGAKQILAEKSMGLYEGGIRTALALQEQTQKNQFGEQALFFSQKSKAMVLLEALQDMKAKQLGALPDSLQEEELNLKVNMTYLEKKIYDEQKQKDQADQEQLQVWKDTLFTLKRSYEHFKEHLEKNYPQYYQLKYQKQEVSLTEIQSQLDEHKVLMEFFVGDDSYYLFRITKNDYKIFTLATDEQQLTKDIVNFRRSLSDMDYIFKDDSVDIVLQQYHQLAHSLYQRLLKKSLADLGEDIKHLIVIPDGKLGYIPFEVLENDKASNNNDFSKALIHQYIISYAYSSYLLFHGKTEEKVIKQQFGGFAPKYTLDDLAFLDSLDQNNAKDLALSAFKNRGSYQDLPQARTEVEQAAALMNGHKWLANEATEHNFKELAADYGILHLSMHGIVDDNNPLYSKLIFSQTDTLEDGFLTAAELYNMQLNAGLGVLSACNTGLGEMKRGEGIMSLSRAFAYAGCPSLVMSLWSVPDESTSKIMIHFYEELAKGLSKDEALRLAKLRFMENAPPERRHPYFWAGFVPLGDMQPIIDGEWLSNWRMFIIFTVVGLIVFIILVRRKEDKQWTEIS